MTRAVSSQSSPTFISYETFSNAMKIRPFEESSSKPKTQTKIKIKNETKFKPDRSSRPTYSQMIDEAISEKYKRRKGTSLVAIKKYIEEKFDLDVKNFAIKRRICRYLRNSVGEGGHLKQLTGKGANGSFDFKNKNQKKKKKEQSSQVQTRAQTISSINIKPTGNLKNLVALPSKTSSLIKAKEVVRRMRAK